MTEIDLTADCRAAYARRGFSDDEMVMWAQAGVNARVAVLLREGGIGAPDGDVRLAVRRLKAPALQARLAAGETIGQIAAALRPARKASTSRSSGSDPHRIDGVAEDRAWRSGRRVYVSARYGSELSEALRALGATWDPEHTAFWVGARRLDEVMPLLAAAGSLAEEKAAADEAKVQAIRQALRSGEMVFTRGARGWRVVGPASELTVGEPVTVTRKDGAGTTVWVTAIDDGEVEFGGIVYRSADFADRAPLPVEPQDPAGAAGVWPVADRQAAAVAGLLGVSAPAADGVCRYCGLGLDRFGVCEECR